MLVPIGISVLFVVLFILGYRYLRGFYPGSTVIEEPEGAVDPMAPRLKFFYTTWCPHSQKALGEWKSLKQLIRNEKLKFGGKTIQFEAFERQNTIGSKTLTAENFQRIKFFQAR